MLFAVNTIVLILFVLIPVIYFFILIIKALKKYIKSADIRNEKNIIKKSLGDTIKDYRVTNKMTQEFVAERIGVSRQAVSKWEMGISDPSTSNLFALADLFGISAEELLKNVQK